MAAPSVRRFGRLFDRTSKLPTERDWERSALLEPELASRDPGLVSDGAGLPFPPNALYVPADPLTRPTPRSPH